MPTPATSRQSKALSALAERRSRNGGSAMPAHAWDDTNVAEKILMRSPSWRTYRKQYPR